MAELETPRPPSRGVDHDAAAKALLFQAQNDLDAALDLLCSRGTRSEDEVRREARRLLGSAESGIACARDELDRARRMEQPAVEAAEGGA